ncbi:MAG TPA: FtsW/RodA/SpoVE family cell cycle protein, partial [Acidobacteriota bacterium]|nr:FtsW/RodA/SpoVE family cell cycle protein [Acidobacteriota bacterium]
PFGQFLAAGITVMIVLQAFINISVVIGILPTKGLPLPFISSGGSSLLVSMIGVGVLLNISQNT